MELLRIVVPFFWYYTPRVILILKKIMNRYEFNAIGLLLFGNTWKTELAKSLNKSTVSNGINKIAKGEKTITQETEEKLIELLQNKGELLINAAQQLKTKEKVFLTFQEDKIITIDELGIRTWDKSEEYPVSQLGVVLSNMKLPFAYEESNLLHSITLSLKYDEAMKKANNKEFIELIKEYFDFRMVGGVQILDKFIKEG